MIQKIPVFQKIKISRISSFSGNRIFQIFRFPENRNFQIFRKWNFQNFQIFRKPKFPENENYLIIINQVISRPPEPIQWIIRPYKRLKIHTIKQIMMFEQILTNIITSFNFKFLTIKQIKENI